MSKSLMYSAAFKNKLIQYSVLTLLTVLTLQRSVLAEKAPSFTHTLSLSPVLSMSWVIQNNQIWIQLSKSTPGWAAIAWGQNMTAGDVLEIQKLPDDTSKLNVTNCYFVGHRPPACDMVQQYTMLEGTSTDSNFTV